MLMVGVNSVYAQYTFEGTFVMTKSVTSTKKKYLIIFILLLILFAASMITTLLTSKEIELRFPSFGYEHSNYSVEFETEGIAETGSIREENGDIILCLKALHPGSTYVNFQTTHKDDPALTDTFSFTIQVTGLGIIYSHRYTFNGIHLVFLYLAIFLLTLSVLLFIWHRQSKKAFHFSYKTILDFGLSLFFLAQSLILFATIIYTKIAHITLEGEHLFTVIALSLTFISLVATPVLLIFSVLITISNIGLIRKEGAHLSNALGILLSALLIIGLISILMLTFMTNYYLSPGALITWVAITRGIVSSLFFYFVCILFSTLLFCLLAGRHKPAYDKDYLIILGCGIRDDGTLYPLLQGRADRAIEFYKEQLEKTGRKAFFVPSGGQGPDECMPEGLAIRNYLLSQGIPEEQILPETESVNTLQNMKFSRKIIDANATDPEKSCIAFSTTNYHVYRSGILASDVGMNADGMGARTKWYFWPNALIREFVGLMVREWRTHAFLCVMFILQSVISGNLSWFFSLIP